MASDCFHGGILEATHFTFKVRIIGTSFIVTFDFVHVYSQQVIFFFYLQTLIAYGHHPSKYNHTCSHLPRIFPTPPLLQIIHIGDYFPYVVMQGFSYGPIGHKE